MTAHPQAHPARTLAVLVIAAGVILVALGFAIVAAPDVAPVILLGAFLVDAVGGVVIYTYERRRHW